MLSIISGVLPKMSSEAVVGALVALAIWSMVNYLFNKSAAPVPASQVISGRRRTRRTRLEAPDNLAPAVALTIPNAPNNSVVAQTVPNALRRQPAGPPIAIAAGASSVSIIVGSRSSISDPYVDSKEELERLCERVQGQGGITVEAELQHKAFSPDGFRLLGEHLAVLATFVSPDRWEDVTVRFPMEAPQLAQSRYEGDMIETEYLQHLVWTGHREQLTNSFLPLTERTLGRLTHLDLNCTISIHDCERLLIACPNLIKFIIYGLGRVDDVLLKLKRSDQLTLQLQFLEKLVISSTEDINALLRNFTYPALQSITLLLDYPNPLPQDLPWDDFGALSKVKIRARGMTPTDVERTKCRCPNVNHDITIKYP